MTPDPSLFISTEFTRYDKDGRITSTGVMGLGIIQQLRITEGHILPGFEADWRTEWIDASSGTPARAPRPVLELPASLEVEAGVEAVVSDLPACLVRFTGPLSGEQPHDEDGDLLIGFMIPGVYTLKGEAFPYQPFEITLTVTE